jgi:hypothetical protein
MKYECQLLINIFKRIGYQWLLKCMIDYFYQLAMVGIPAGLLSNHFMSDLHILTAS